MSLHEDTTEDTPEELVLPSSEGAQWPTTSPDEDPTPPGRNVVLDPATVLAPAETEMCCDDSGRTAEQHRAESADHKCCIDT
jgi:hypothetical protein